MDAYPWANTNEQSSQATLETLALALEPGATGRAHARAWLQRSRIAAPIRVTR